MKRENLCNSNVKPIWPKYYFFWVYQAYILCTIQVPYSVLRIRTSRRQYRYANELFSMPLHIFFITCAEQVSLKNYYARPSVRSSVRSSIQGFRTQFCVWRCKNARTPISGAHTGTASARFLRANAKSSYIISTYVKNKLTTYSKYHQQYTMLVTRSKACKT